MQKSHTYKLLIHTKEQLHPPRFSAAFGTGCLKAPLFTGVRVTSAWGLRCPFRKVGSVPPPGTVWGALNASRGGIPLWKLSAIADLLNALFASARVPGSGFPLTPGAHLSDLGASGSVCPGQPSVAETLLCLV